MTKKYTKEHEWIEQHGAHWRIGITEYAQEQLGDVVMVDLPAVGRNVSAGEECMAIESVKAASDIYSPIAGAIVAVNETLLDNPALVNEDPENSGWLFDLEANATDNLETLMDAASYQSFVEELQ